MKLVKEYIVEKFSSDSDPIKDLNIGYAGMIKMWLADHNVEKYTINDDFSITLFEPVKLHIEDNELPKYINFKESSGYFAVKSKKLVSLRGFPKKISITMFLFDCPRLTKEEILNFVFDKDVDENMYISSPFFNNEQVIYIRKRYQSSRKLSEKFKLLYQYNREVLNEKFIEDSDPIKDLNIGYASLHSLKRGDIFSVNKNIYLNVDDSARHISGNSVYTITDDASQRHMVTPSWHGLCLKKIMKKNRVRIHFLGFASLESARSSRDILIAGRGYTPSFGAYGIFDLSFEEWRKNFVIIE